MIRKLYGFFTNYIKRPFFYRFFVLRWELYRKPPFFFHYFGYKVFYKPKDGLVYHVGSTGSFEKEVIGCCRKFLPDKAIVFDVGANIGLITLPLARLLPQAIFHCFEPSPYPYGFFKKTIKENKLKHRVKLNKFGLYEKKSKLKFYIHNFKDASSDGIRDTHRAGKTSPILVNVTTLDRYVADNKIKRVDLIKIDIEGSELYVLRGAIKTIRRFNPKIIFEAWPKNLEAYGLKVQDLYRFFNKIGYQIYTLKGKRLGEKAFIQSTQKEANYMASPIKYSP